MTKIKPFKALIYNNKKVADVSKVVCPPYDIIPPKMQLAYHQRNNFNLIHILLGQDTPGEDKYQRAANYFKNWIKEKILIQDEHPAVYFYSQQYNIKGERKTRLGFVGLLHLGDKDLSVFGHEHTRLEPKEDRLKLLQQVKANLSPIFVIFPDKKRIIQRVYQQLIQDTAAFIDLKDDEGTVHKVWRIDSSAILADMQAKIADENIFIADGHHRYEVACAYRNAIQQQLGLTHGDEDFNYIMTYFTNTDPRSLTILPIHRLIKLNPGFDLDTFKINISEYFELEEIRDKIRFFFLMEKAGSSEHVIGMYKDKKYWLLRLKNIKVLDKMIPDKPNEYRSLDVSILNSIVLKKVIGLDLEGKNNLVFSADREELIEQVNADSFYIAFFLNPVKIQQIISVALKGEKMPPKSTYFYPKVLSGLVINKLDI